MNQTRPADGVIDYLDAFDRLLQARLPMPEPAGPLPSIDLDHDRPLAMLVSPHPDDECLVGGLALRLRREAGYAVLNLAATLGSLVERREARWCELSQACGRLGFALADAGFAGREPISEARRHADPTSWERDVALLAALLDRYRPRLLMFPNARDGSATHIGVHRLVLDALQRYERPLWLAQTEFWGTLDDPNLLLELRKAEVATLLDALLCHRGEIARNPYHLRLASWLSDSVRRGGENVPGAGAQPPSFPFGALYRVDRWSGRAIETVERRAILDGGADLRELFPPLDAR
ncbi:PIG-L deacetylase family protein [Burkholderia gladioli]|uniref:PIG-L deacetylase family protein n=1 Tax=Burkholderia gladioli TaxID=28095 RepID=UPI0023645E41|nr:PIG-L family deacetylase [Burkholderia gladioli]MDD1785566.1 PIG-L family deacetylase [Burkholderia gladioli]